VAKKESSVANLGGNKKRGAAGISWCEKLREKTEIIPFCWAFASVYIEFATIIALFVGAIPFHTFMSLLFLSESNEKGTGRYLLVK
jgi:hypothetical protein